MQRLFNVQDFILFEDKDYAPANYNLARLKLFGLNDNDLNTIREEIIKASKKYSPDEVSSYAISCAQEYVITGRLSITIDKSYSILDRVNLFNFYRKTGIDARLNNDLTDINKYTREELQHYRKLSNVFRQNSLKLDKIDNSCYTNNVKLMLG